MLISNFLKDNVPSFAGFKEQPIVNKLGSTVGWHSHCYQNGNQYPLGGGTATDRETARRISIAETFERFLFRKQIDSGKSELFLFDQVPSTCGLACGFDLSKTKMRSFCEGVERWAWSQWIDRKHTIDEMTAPTQLSELSIHLASAFIGHKYYQKKLIVQLDNVQYDVNFNVFLGMTDRGVFAGSRVTGKFDDQWGHAIIEAWRNYNNFQLFNENIELDWLERRVFFFGRNKGEALLQINATNNINWPIPVVRFHSRIDTEIEGVYLFRTLLEDYVPWTDGNDNRFVY